MAYDLSGPDNAAQAQGTLPNPQVTGQASAVGQVPPNLSSGAAVGPPPISLAGKYTLSNPDAYVSPFAAPTAADNVLNKPDPVTGFDPQQGFADIARRSMQKIAEHDATEHPESKLASFIEGMGAGQGGILGGLSNIISSQRAARERDYQGALKNLNQVVSNVGATHIKSAIADQQAAAKASAQEITKQHNAALDAVRQRMATVKEKHEASSASHLKQLESLQKYGIDSKNFNFDELQKSRREMYDKTDERLRDAARVSAALRMRGQDQQAAQFQAKMKELNEKDASELGYKVSKYNDEAAKILSKHDASGNLIYHDENGKPLPFTPLKFDGLSAPDMPIDSGDEADAIMQKYFPQQQAAPQQGAPQGQPQDAQGAPAIAQGQAPAPQPAQRPRLELTNGPEPSKGAEIAKAGDASGVAAISAERRAKFNRMVAAGYSEPEVRNAIMQSYIKQGKSRKEAFELSEQF